LRKTITECFGKTITKKNRVGNKGKLNAEGENGEENTIGAGKEFTRIRFNHQEINQEKKTKKFKEGAKNCRRRTVEEMTPVGGKAKSR